jgi:hypothetical protein
LKKKIDGEEIEGITSLVNELFEKVSDFEKNGGF